MAENTWVTHWGYFIPISGVTWAPYQAADHTKFIKNIDGQDNGLTHGWQQNSTRGKETKKQLKDKNDLQRSKISELQNVELFGISKMLGKGAGFNLKNMISQIGSFPLS